MIFRAIPQAGMGVVHIVVNATPSVLMSGLRLTQTWLQPSNVDGGLPINQKTLPASGNGSWNIEPSD
jgi:hypothetical protein